MENTTKNEHAWMYWLALFTLVIGISIGLTALIAPMGYRFELWGYRTSFEILRTVVPYSIYIAGFCLVVAIVLGVLGKKWDMRNTTIQVGLAIAGAIVAGITWFVPNSHLAPEHQPYPSIHDISTDTVNPPEFVAILPLRANADNPVEYGVSRDMNPQLLVELTKQAYPDLQPVILEVPPEAAFDRALTAVNTLKWELVEANRQSGRIEATDTTFWFGFKDDIVIRIQPEGIGSHIDARSLSRVGKGDAGANAKRLRAFFEIL